MFEGWWDAVTLARAQFAFTMSFHIVFPAFSIGLASYLAVLEARWLLTGREVFLNLFNYWLKIFAVAFGMGVVSGIVMAYQFGTNWSAFADKTGPWRELQLDRFWSQRLRVWVFSERITFYPTGAKVTRRRVQAFRERQRRKA
jgi:hypothetical protein